MAQALFDLGDAHSLSIRLGNRTKDDFAKCCDTVGMSVSTLFSVFAKTVVRGQKIPFEISAKNDGEDDDDWNDYVYWQTQDRKTPKK